MAIVIGAPWWENMTAVGLLVAACALLIAFAAYVRLLHARTWR